MNNIIDLKDIDYPEPMVRAKELSKIFVGISPSAITKWADRGVITPYKIGGAVFYKLSEIKLLIEKSKVF